MEEMDTVSSMELTNEYFLVVTTSGKRIKIKRFVFDNLLKRINQFPTGDMKLSFSGCSSCGPKKN